VIARLRSGLDRGITRNVLALALISLLTDLSSEMLVYVVPLFLGAGPAVIGLIEGIAESAAGLLKLVSGAIALAILPASIIAGILWDAIAPAAPFWFGAACAVLAVVVLTAVRPMRNMGDGAAAA
jgi:predicted MFS family arabinose efflux permease